MSRLREHAPRVEVGRSGRLRRQTPVAIALLIASLACTPKPPQLTPDTDAAHSEAIARKLAALRAEIEQEGLTPTRALDFARLARGEYRVQQRGDKAPDPADTDEAIALLLRAADEHLLAGAELRAQAAELYVLRDEPKRAAQLYLDALVRDPKPELFRGLLDLPCSPEVDAAVLTACPHMRPVASPTDATDLALVCLETADGDRSKLTWPEAAADLSVIDDELRAARSEEQHLELLATARTRVFSQRRLRITTIAAVFGSGLCHVENCGRGGWTGHGLDGDVTVRCGESGCLYDGWDARLPGGLVARTRCFSRDCLSRGWKTTFPDGQEIKTTCLYGKCATAGWVTYLPEGGEVQAHCTDGDCLGVGWTTTLVDASRYRCTCVREGCKNHGAECR